MYLVFISIDDTFWSQMVNLVALGPGLCILFEFFCHPNDRRLFKVECWDMCHCSTISLKIKVSGTHRVTENLAGGGGGYAYARKEGSGMSFRLASF